MLKHIQDISKEDISKLIFDNAKIGFCFIGLNGEFLKVNTQLTEMLGYTEYELSTKTFKDITHPEDLMADMDLLRRTIAKEITGYPMTKRYFTKEGHMIWARLTVTRVDGIDDAVACFFSQIQPLETDKNAIDSVRKMMEIQNESMIKSKDKNNKFVAFLSKEWKWILMFTLTGIGGVIAWEVNRKTEEFKTEERFVEIEEDMGEIKEDMTEGFDEIKEILKSQDSKDKDE